MADTVVFQTSALATPPDATVIATDDAGAAGQVQIVKLAIATDGSATLIPAVAADGLLVNLGTNNDVTVTGTVTEASGSAIAASLSVIDDWDETNRAAVNLISGQAGIAGGTGVDGATVPRVTLATNVALPAGTNGIGKLTANSGVDIGDVDVTSINSFAAHDAGIAGNPLIVGGVSSAAAPTSVSGDQEAVRAWFLRNGAAATVLTAAGALIGGDATNGLDVDVTRVPGPSYIASAAQTQTNLDGLADSATHVAGWESTAIDNSTNRYRDYRINAKLVTEGSSVTAGVCKMWLVAEMDDSTWPDVFDGTESAETVVDTEQRDAICRLAAISAHDTGTAETIYLMCPSVAAVFNGVVPRKFVIFITQNTGTTLETTGDPNQVYVAGVA